MSLTRLAHIGPNWFTSVMGTGILAIAASLLPVHIPGLDTAALLIWVLATLMLLLLCVATLAHWILHPRNARAHASSPVMAQFYGAPPMALLTIGSGALLVGRQLIGFHAALTLDALLWSLGTLAGLASSIAIPYLTFTRHHLAPTPSPATRLLPVVPPMVSASAGAALVAHLPAGQDRLALLLACYALFGISLIASLVLITLVWARLAQHGPGPAETVPTLWIVLGPLGQSVTAANLLAQQAHGAIRQPYAAAMNAMGLLYGVPVWGFAMLWLLLAAAITIRTARRGLPFTLTWWSFTFPVGTLVTATSELAIHSHLRLLDGLSLALCALLAIAWLTVASRTAAGLLDGRLLRSPAPPIAQPAL